MICHLAGEYHRFLWLAEWTTWWSGRMTSQRCTLQTQGVDCWCSMHTTMWVYTSFYTLWKRIESFNEYYLIFYWMMLLLLSEVNNTTILLMALLNAIDGKNRWSLYTARLLLLLLAIDKRPTWFVVMAWNNRCDLASRFFSNAVVEDKSIGWYCHNTGQHQLGFSICCAPCQLLLYCGLCEISSGANLAPESLRTVCASGTLQGTQVTVANCPVTNKVDCHEEFYSFTNQAFVLLLLGACQEWWRLLAQSTLSTQWCVDTMFLLLLLR